LTIRVPDVSVIAASAVNSADLYLQSPPLLAVEVASPANTRRKMQRKLRDYAAIGIPEVWLVAPLGGETVEVLLLKGDRYETVALTAEGAIHPSAVPEAAIDVAGIFSTSSESRRGAALQCQHGDRTRTANVRTPA
jgi:Uma2 family endonuclease